MLSAAKGVLGRLPVLSPWKWALLLLLLTLVFQVRVQHLDERLYFWIKTSWHADEWQARSLWLPEYRVRIDAKAVPGVGDNLSGLTYDERERGVVVELMDSRAVCRTYNVLLAEGRRVAAAMLPV